MTGVPGITGGAADVARREELSLALGAVEDRLAAACAAAGRPRSEVVLVAVSKTWPAADVALLSGLGVRDFGENKDQEAGRKAAALRAAGVDELRWHFVGQLQTNKARSVASYAAVVHSLDRPRLADALDAGARRAARTVRVLLQVDLDLDRDGDASADPARGGCRPADLPAMAERVAGLPGLRLAGVMAVAPQDGSPERAFERLAGLAAELRRAHPEATEISAGMSGDLEQAVAAGATHVRVGTSLFGRRPPVLG